MEPQPTLPAVLYSEDPLAQTGVSSETMQLVQPLETVLTSRLVTALEPTFGKPQTALHSETDRPVATSPTSALQFLTTTTHVLSSLVLMLPSEPLLDVFTPLLIVPQPPTLALELVASTVLDALPA